MKVKQYNGLKEVREITYNSLKTKGVLRIYEIVYNSLDTLFSEEETLKIRKQFMANKIKVRELTNAAYREPIDLPGYEDILEVRCIDPKKVQYKTEIIIYNNVVAFYTYGPNAYGAEIIDQNFTDMQAQIFDQLWQKASRPIIGRNSRSSLI